jgi:hypothetical protein
MKCCVTLYILTNRFVLPGWYLSHIDVHVPSEHTQEGKRYDAEIELFHFYSIDYDNEMATVSVFMEAYDDAPPYPYLDKVICQWRRKEFNIRQQCGLDPVPSSYPGCFPLFRDRNLNEQNNDKTGNLRERNFGNPRKDEDEDDDVPVLDAEGARDEYQQRLSYNPKKPFKTVADIFYFNFATGRNSTLELEDVNFEPAVEKDWDAWIQEQSQKMDQHEELYNKLKNNDYGGKHSDDLHRRLIMGDEMEWFNYWPLIGVRTE